jgi:hypothetical protein
MHVDALVALLVPCGRKWTNSVRPWRLQLRRGTDRRDIDALSAKIRLGQYDPLTDPIA